MGACIECRAAKVKCDGTFPCQRCQLKGKECVPHSSRQGQGPHTRSSSGKRKWDNTQSGGTTGAGIGKTIMKKPEGEEANGIASHLMDDPTVTKDHFGLQHLVRKWIALAIKRRSFHLWTRAGSLAVTCGISMDDILCDVVDGSPTSSANSSSGGRQGMDFLYPFLLTPKEEQKVLGSPLQAGHIPASLWKAIGISYDENDTAGHEGALRDRWIYVREINKGISRFYVSPGFAQNVGVTREMMERTYQANQMDVSGLYMATEQKEEGALQHVRGIAYQMAVHSRPGIIPKPTQLPNVRIRTKSSSGSGGTTKIWEMDQLFCIIIPSMDHSFGLTEFIAPSTACAAAAAGEQKEEEEMVEALVPPAAAPLPDSIDVDREDFKLIYDFLRNS